MSYARSLDVIFYVLASHKSHYRSVYALDPEMNSHGDTPVLGPVTVYAHELGAITKQLSDLSIRLETMVLDSKGWT